MARTPERHIWHFTWIAETKYLLPENYLFLGHTWRAPINKLSLTFQYFVRSEFTCGRQYCAIGHCAMISQYHFDGSASREKHGTDTDADTKRLNWMSKKPTCECIFIFVKLDGKTATSTGRALLDRRHATAMPSSVIVGGSCSIFNIGNLQLLHLATTKIGQFTPRYILE